MSENPLIQRLTEERGGKKDEEFFYFLNNQCGNSVKEDVQAEILLTLKTELLLRQRETLETSHTFNIIHACILIVINYVYQKMQLKYKTLQVVCTYEL